jgi:chaperone modulatory protein CbpM
MAGTNFIRLTDFDLDEALTLDVVAERVGAKSSLIARLAQQGLLEIVESESGETLLPSRVIIRLRRMQRLHHDLGVNFAGAAIILNLVEQVEQLKRELTANAREIQGITSHGNKGHN